MSHFRFIHAADLHIGSQLQKLELYPGAPIERVRGAPQRAVENLVDLAIEQDVVALLIAGDLFDGPWNDVRVGLWLVQQMRRLERAGIWVYCIRGNHDSLSVVRNAIRWPDNVIEFPNQPSTAPMLDCGLVVHGQSFEKPKVTEDLAANYPAAVEGAFNVGLLHTSLNGSLLSSAANMHDTYAPTDLRVLRDRGYQYWALGHIHQRSTVSLAEDFWVGYSGNTQGRNVRESGAKGCYLVDVTDRKIDSVQFHATDVARWTTLEIDLSQLDSMDRLQEVLRTEMEVEHHRAQGRVLALRFLLHGATALHNPLGDQSQYADLHTAIRMMASDLDDVWIEKVLVRTSPLQSDESIRSTSAMLGELLQVADRFRQSADSSIDPSDATVPKDPFEPTRKLLASKLGPYLRELGWATDDDPDWNAPMAGWIHQATQYLTQAFSKPVAGSSIENATAATSNTNEQENTLSSGSQG